MRPVIPDPRVAELVVLDVLDVREDGTLQLNASFHAACVAAYDADPSCLDHVVQDLILQRALERGYAGVADVDALALTALEIATA